MGHWYQDGRLTDAGRVASYLFSSHDGYGLGHVRRNSLVAQAILEREPDARITIVTGLAVRPGWLRTGRMQVVHVPPLVKDPSGVYRNAEMEFHEAIERRAETFLRTVDEVDPDVVVVDRHPYGLAGELVGGLDRAAGRGAALVLGLRDILDDAAAVREELGGRGWHGVASRFDEVLVYGDRVLCDHELEYGLPVTPEYCGWVADRARPRLRDRRLLVVTGGGGGDGDAVFRLGVDLTARMEELRTVLVAGPYAGELLGGDLQGIDDPGGRLRLLRDTPDCAWLLARAGGALQMAGYNSTFEALAAGVRPVLMPRRKPRREQAIRATRLAAMGVADVVDENASADEVAWLIRQPRLLPPDALARAGIRLDGAERAAATIHRMALAVRQVRRSVVRAVTVIH